MPSQQHVKEIFTACDRLDGVVGLLYNLARAAEVLGNDRLADTLSDAFSTVRASSVAIRSGLGGICHEAANAADRASLNLLNTIIAVGEKRDG